MEHHLQYYTLELAVAKTRKDIKFLLCLSVFSLSICWRNLLAANSTPVTFGSFVGKVFATETVSGVDGHLPLVLCRYSGHSGLAQSLRGTA